MNKEVEARRREAYTKKLLNDNTILGTKKYVNAYINTTDPNVKRHFLDAKTGASNSLIIPFFGDDNYYLEPLENTIKRIHYGEIKEEDILKDENMIIDVYKEEVNKYIDKMIGVGKKNNKIDIKMLVIIFVLMLLLTIFIGKVGDLFHSDDKYETYYIDENGNGKLDKGEGNYTTDEDGNVVDWDEDRNNFE